MKKLPFYLALVALLLTAAQCNPIDPPDETGIKPKRDIPEKWAIVGSYSSGWGGFTFYPPCGDILEFWPDSTYKVYNDNVLVGDGTYTYYLRVEYPGSTYLFPFISLTGYSLHLWELGIYVMDEEHEIIHFIGDSLCPPSPLNYELPEGLLDSLHAHNLSDKIMRLEAQAVNSRQIFFVKIEN